MNKFERLGLEKVCMYLDLACSYDNFADRKKAILRAVECLDAVLNIDGKRFCNRLFDGLKREFSAEDVFKKKV